MKKTQNRPRLTDRAYELAERLDPKGNRARAIEFALEVHAALIGAASDRVYPFDKGPMSADASNMVQAFEGLVKDRLFGQAIDRAIVAYERRTSARDAEKVHVAAGSGDPDVRESGE